MEDKKERCEEIPKKLYATCPVCSGVLIRAECVNNAVIKCGKCKNLISVNIQNGRVITNTNLPEKE